MEDLSGKRTYKMKCIKISDSGEARYLEKKEPRIKKGWARIKLHVVAYVGAYNKIVSIEKQRLLINKQIWGHEFSGLLMR